ncbi:hypothetical protein D3C81_2005520 [compost metagenome]
MGQKRLARSGQRHSSILPAEQGQPQLGLKCAHQLTQRRLRNTQLFSRPAEVLQVGGDNKGFQMTQFHESHP